MTDRSLGKLDHDRDSLSLCLRSMQAELLACLTTGSQILECWTGSQKTLGKAMSCLGEADSRWDCFETVGVSGSYARMEGGEASDFDILLIARDGAEPHVVNHADHKLRLALVELGLKLPNPEGIFSKPIRRSDLFIASIGKIDEEPGSFGSRIQLLLDGRPLIGVDRFRILQREVVRRYLTPVPAARSGECWDYLLHDLSRYFRCLSLKYLWESQDQLERWAVRTIKGLFSRPLMHFALVMLLGASLKKGRDPEAWLTARLHLTPLERLAVVGDYKDKELLRRLLSLYSDFLLWSSQSDHRRSVTVSELEAWKDRAREFHAVLIQMLLNNRGEWPASFFQRILF